MSILWVGNKTWQMQTQMLISWVLIPVGTAQHVTCHIYVIAQYPATAGLCKLTSFSRSDCTDLSITRMNFSVEKIPNHVSHAQDFKPGTSSIWVLPPTEVPATLSSQNCTNTNHCSKHLELVHFPCSGSFCCPLSQLYETSAAYKLQSEKCEGKGSLRLFKKKKKPMQSSGENTQNLYWVGQAFFILSYWLNQSTTISNILKVFQFI